MSCDCEGVFFYITQLKDNPQFDFIECALLAKHNFNFMIT